MEVNDEGLGIPREAIDNSDLCSIGGLTLDWQLSKKSACATAVK